MRTLVYPSGYATQRGSKLWNVFVVADELVAFRKQRIQFSVIFTARLRKDQPFVAQFLTTMPEFAESIFRRGPQG